MGSWIRFFGVGAGLLLTAANGFAATGADAPFNQVFRAATHNSYWVKRNNVVEAFASGTQERLLDQLLFDHARALEIDIHKNDHVPHDWSIYHTNMPSNVFCTPLSECLKQLQQFQYALPEHEAVVVVIELKEIFEHNFDSAHTPADLDRILESYLGPYLYRPRDFLSRCAAGTTLRDCAKQVGWPTVGELRGKFILTVLGNWRFCTVGHGPSGWAEYATWKGDGGHGAADRSAFPMESNWIGYSKKCGDEYVPPDEVREAQQASIFRQAEDLSPAKLADAEQFLSEGGIVRGSDSFSLADQQSRVELGFQMLQTDYPWVQLGEAGPAQPFHAFRPDIYGPIVEPGNRIGFWRAPQGGGSAFGWMLDYSSSSVWETLPATTRPSPNSTYVNPRWARGKGCLRAAGPAGSVSVCRQTVSGKWYIRKPHGEDIAVSVEVDRGGARSSRVFYSAANSSRGAGDLLKLEIAPGGRGKTCALAYTSAEMASASQPLWKLIDVECFEGELPEQGLAAQGGDVLFVGTKHDGAPVSAAALEAVPSWTGYAVRQE